MYVYRNKGMILISVLIFLQVATFFILQALRLSTIETKQSHLALQKLTATFLTVRALHKIEQQIINNSQMCRIPVTDLKTLLTRPLDWWQSFSTCGGYFENLEYYFVVEELGVDPCAIVHSYNHKVANFLRITLIGIFREIKIKMQSVIVLPIDANLDVCKGILHPVISGRQHWHEIN